MAQVGHRVGDHGGVDHQDEGVAGKDEALGEDPQELRVGVGEGAEDEAAEGVDLCGVAALADEVDGEAGEEGVEEGDEDAGEQGGLGEGQREGEQAAADHGAEDVGRGGGDGGVAVGVVRGVVVSVTVVVVVGGDTAWWSCAS